MRAKTGTRQHTLTYAAHAPPGTSAEHRACFTPKRSLVRTQYRPPSESHVSLAAAQPGAHLSDSTCSGVRDLDWRPGWPIETSVSSTTFRFTLSRAIARLTARFKQARISCTVRVLWDRDSPASR